MFVPIIIDPCAFYDYRYLWVYLKFLFVAYKNNWALIASNEFSEYREKRPISNVYENNFKKLHQYEILTKNEEETVQKFFINQKIFDDLKQKKGSVFETKYYLLKKSYKPLERELRGIVKKIKKITQEKIEGFLVWNSCYKSIRVIAKKLKIPVITAEFALRFPEYYSLSYFCFEEIYSENEIKKMYFKFKNDMDQINIELFSREELLAIFLQDDRLGIIEEKNVDLYEMGIAGCHPVITTFFAKSMYTDLELIEDVRKEYSEEDILFRKHPGDEPYQAKYTLKNQDKSMYASDFIRKCKRITAVGSNTLLEAMLLGKTIYSNGISPFTFWGEKNLHVKDIKTIDYEVLNFILLVYLVPYNKMQDEKYIRWRMQGKRCDILFMNNIEYYFRERNIPSNVLYFHSNERKNEIIKYRKKNMCD